MPVGTAYMKDYFADNARFVEQYGEKTILLKQCGVFWEMYGLAQEDGSISGSAMAEIARITDLKIANRLGSQIHKMIGFGLSSRDKYVGKMMNAGYTVPIMPQVRSGSNSEHYLEMVVTPGTSFVDNESTLSRHTACLWVEKLSSTFGSSTHPKILCGMSVMDVFTGESAMGEFDMEYRHQSATFDEMERFVSVYSPTETLIIHNLSNEDIEDIIHFIGLTSRKIHIIPFDDPNQAQDIVHCQQQTYQECSLNVHYPNRDMDIFFEPFRQRLSATSAFCYLLNYLHNNNSRLTREIGVPTIITNPDRLITANHSLVQLNILEDGQHTGKNAAVVSSIDHCMTPMGSRSLRKVILSPTALPDTLTREYDITEFSLENYSIVDDIRCGLRDVRDFDKINRMISMDTIKPPMFCLLADSVQQVKNLAEKLSLYAPFKTYYDIKLCHERSIESMCEEVCNFIEHTLILEECQKADDANNFHYIRQGIDAEHDKLKEGLMDGHDILEAIRKYFDDLCVKHEPKRRSNTQLVRLEHTDKTGYSLQMTSRREHLLKTSLAQNMALTNNISLQYSSTYMDKDKTFLLDITSLVYAAGKSGKRTISSPQIDQLFSSATTSIEHVKICVNKIYKSFVASFSEQKLTDILFQISEYTAMIDMMQNRAHVARKYNYCKPEIDMSSETAFIECTGLRHPIIERINTRETYVTNDVNIGQEVSGMLIYGTNAVGKTSLMRSVGIAVIMSQAGFYVPCTTFLFKPYTQIFTRIVGNDNLFKGLSSFAVEMSEFRTILSNADKSSLILGDELCNGTESNSATAIFVTGIKHLHQRNCSFLFATHFHQIVELPEITELTAQRLRLKHMAVRYLQERDELVYDRKLSDGSGDRNYGLEVCRALDLPQDFLSEAHAFRRRYNSDGEDTLAMRPSRYNASVIVDLCQECGKKAIETHHLQPQRYADGNGFIGHVPVHHPANLQPLCKECHAKKTKDQTIQRRVKTSNGYRLEAEETSS